MSYSRYNRQRDRDSGWYPRSERDWYGRRRGHDENWHWDRDRDYGERDRERGDWFRDYGYGRAYDYLGDRAGASGVPGGAWGYDESWRRDPGWRTGWEGTGYTRPGYGRDYHGSRYGYDERPSGRGWWDRASDEVSSWFGDEYAARRREEDRRRDDQEDYYYRGRGPRGYTRSDDRIRDDVSDRLADNPILDASEIDVSVSGGEVTLGGSVDSRYSKRLAEDLADDVLGVKNVQNNLRVREKQFRRESVSGTYWEDAQHQQGQASSELGRTVPSGTSTSTAAASKTH